MESAASRAYRSGSAFFGILRMNSLLPWSQLFLLSMCQCAVLSGSLAKWAAVDTTTMRCSSYPNPQENLGWPIQAFFWLAWGCCGPNPLLCASLTCLRQVEGEMNNACEVVSMAITPNESATLPFVIPSEAACSYGAVGCGSPLCVFRRSTLFGHRSRFFPGSAVELLQKLD